MNRILTGIYILIGSLMTVTAFAENHVVIFGLDETGSYSFRERAVSIAKSVIRDLKPGDIFYLRRITEKSYIDSCAVFRLELPKIGNPPKNKFDKNSRKNWNRKLKKIMLLKSRAASLLAKLQPVKSRKTDIWGFLAAAADRIQVEIKQGSKPVIIITSDMQDNCNRTIQVDLKGAEVVIAGFESTADPRKTQSIRSNWEKVLKRCNASVVTFLPPDFGNKIIISRSN